jgi:hypothetical protein
MVDVILFENLDDLGAERFLGFSVFGIASTPLVILFKLIQMRRIAMLLSPPSAPSRSHGMAFFLAVWLG